MSGKIKVGIVGASGYAGVELVKILAKHSKVSLECVTARALAGTSVVESMPTLRHILCESLTYIQSDPKLLAEMDIDVWFLALPHSAAAEFAKELIAKDKLVIDLSADFRLNSMEVYKKYYGGNHPAPELLEMGQYVIAELFEAKSKLIACAGCYPTSILVPLIPLLRESVVETKNIVINSYSGVSGAGKKADLAYTYSLRNESVKAYGLTTHRHLSEIEEQLSIASKEEVIVQFNPHLAPMTRGISTTITLSAKYAGIEKVYEVWNKYYANKPFIKVLKSGVMPDTLEVNSTNRCDISAMYDERTNNIVICSVIDNLVKGASGQAVQIMNQSLGFDETEGLL